MLENKADFIVEFNESTKKTIKRNDVDWSQSRVVFVSQSFTENQKIATNFKDLGIELWETKRYENNIISISPIKKSGSAESIKPLTQSSKEMEAVQKEIKVYTEEDHLRGKPEETIELYESYKEAILNLDNDIDLRIKKLEIGFEKKGRLFFDIHLQKKGLKMWINLKKGELDDPKSLFRDMSDVGHIGNGDYEIQVNDTTNLEYIMSLVKQAI
jgi:predicted transport protein